MHSWYDLNLNSSQHTFSLSRYTFDRWFLHSTSLPHRAHWLGEGDFGCPQALMLNHYIQVIHTSRCARGLAMRSTDNVLPEPWHGCKRPQSETALKWTNTDGQNTLVATLYCGCDMLICTCQTQHDLSCVKESESSQQLDVTGISEWWYGSPAHAWEVGFRWVSDPPKLICDATSELFPKRRLFTAPWSQLRSTWMQLPHFWPEAPA